MASGIYVAMSGAQLREEALQTASNNLANVLTPGFKRQEPVYREIHNSVASLGDPRQAMGVHHPRRFLPEDRIRAQLDERYTQFEQGALKKTHNPLDLAIEGEGFFTIAGPNGPVYTRNGSFTLGADGTIVTHTGAAVLDRQGQPLRVPSAAARLNVTIEGEVQADGAPVGQVGLVRFDDPRQLQRLGDSGFTPANPNVQPLRANEVVVHQGWLEGANVNPISAMTLLIKTHRIFDLNTKLIEAYRQMDQLASREVGRSQ